MNKIQQFLEENQYVELPCECSGKMSTKEKDIILVKFVLLQVEIEVEKLYDIKQFTHLPLAFNYGHKRGLEDVLHIINSLRLK